MSVSKNQSVSARTTAAASMASRKSYDHLVKTIIVGDSGVGKTCLLRRFSDEPFVEFHMTTIGVDFAVKTMKVEGKTAKMQIWDTAGQERFHTITTAYYRGADALLLVFDVSNPESFEHCEHWLREIREYTKDVQVLLVGNKVDIPASDRVVDSATAQKFAEEVDVPYIETSAKGDTNVHEAFVSVAAAAIKRKSTVKPEPEDDVVVDGHRRTCPSCTIL